MAKDLETSKKDNFRQKMQKVCKLCSAATIDVYVRNTLRLVKLLDPQAKIIPSEGGFLENPKILQHLVLESSKNHSESLKTVEKH